MVSEDTTITCHCELRELTLEEAKGAQIPVTTSRVGITEYSYDYGENGYNSYEDQNVEDRNASLNKTINQLHCNSHDECTTSSRCFASMHMDQHSHRIYLNYGCLSNKAAKQFYCFGDGTKQKYWHMLCCDGAFCNSDLNPYIKTIPTFDPANKIKNSAGTSIETIIMFFIAIPVLAVAVLVLSLLYWRRQHQLKKSSVNTGANREFQECRLIENPGEILQMGVRHQEPRVLNLSSAGDYSGPKTGYLSTIGDELDTGSGSGMGMTWLVQRTIAKQIKLCEQIGKGRYGEVRRGLYNGQSVAVKIFASREEYSWRRETELYNSVNLRHENLLRFIASDMTSRDFSYTELWMITEYHERGCLFDFLQHNVLDRRSLKSILVSAADGLLHLHTEFRVATAAGGVNQGKDSIAHRDIKSRNILVKRDNTCCISDLGFSVVQSRLTETITDSQFNLQAGTVRQMPPEVLSNTLNISVFSSFKHADVYSFGLVIWECIRRTQLDMQDNIYEAPYSEWVSTNPTIPEMEQVVVHEKKRPSFTGVEEANLADICELAEECWMQSASQRATMLRVKKTLSAMKL